MPRIKDNSLSTNTSKFRSIATCMVIWWLVLLVPRRLLSRAMDCDALSSSNNNSSNRSLEQVSHHPSLQPRSRSSRSSNHNHSTRSLITSIFTATHRLSSKINPCINNINIALHHLVDINSNRG